MNCPKCKHKDLIGVEYSWDSPEHYDGISEWMCPICQTRIGRWSKKVLANDEIERRYGITKEEREQVKREVEINMGLKDCNK